MLTFYSTSLPVQEPIYRLRFEGAPVVGTHNLMQMSFVFRVYFETDSGIWATTINTASTLLLLVPFIVTLYLLFLLDRCQYIRTIVLKIFYVN